MKQAINEVRRMQLLAGIIKEDTTIYSGEEQEVGRLAEVGEGSAQAYDWKLTKSLTLGTGENKTIFTNYGFLTDDVDKEGNELPPVKYHIGIITAVEFDRNVIACSLAFGIVQVVRQGGRDWDVADYDVTSKDTQTGNLYRVIKTVIETVNDYLFRQKEDPHLSRYVDKLPTVIEIRPSKERDEKGNQKQSDMRRANLYLAYIQKHKPEGSKVEMTPDGDTIQITIEPGQ